MESIEREIANRKNCELWETIGLDRKCTGVYERRWNDHLFVFYPADGELAVTHCSGREAVHSAKTAKAVKKIIARYMEDEHSLFK